MTGAPPTGVPAAGDATGSAAENTGEAIAGDTGSARKGADVAPVVAPAPELSVLERRNRAQTRLRWELLRNLVRKDLKVKYKGSTLGFAWSLANPLLLLAVLPH